MTTLLLADGADFDWKIWIYLIFIALSVIGGIFGKKKQQEQKRQQRSSPGARRPAARPQAPAPPRAAQPPRPPRPTRLERPPTRAVPPAGFPEARPARPRPTVPPLRPVEARPTPPMRRPVPVPSLRERPLEAEPAPPEAELVPEEPSALGTPTGRGRAPAEGPRVQPGVQLRRAQRLLSNKPGLRTAFVLSEILAPPVGLRHNHLV